MKVGGFVIFLYIESIVHNGHNVSEEESLPVHLIASRN